MKLPFDVFRPREFHRLQMGWFLYGNRNYMENGESKIAWAHFPDDFTEDQKMERIELFHKLEQEKGLSWYPVKSDGKQ